MPRGLGLHGGDEAELGDEAVVVGGELAVDAAREGVGGQLALERRAVASRRQRVALGEPGKGAGRREPTGRLGDDVVVGRRARGCGRPRGTPGASGSGAARRVVVEEVGHARPVVEQPADPHPAHQPDADLDAAGPVHAGQERVRRHHERSWAATTSAYGSSWVSHQAAASTVRWWWRESSQTDLTLPVTVSSRWSMRKASVVSGRGGRSRGRGTSPGPRRRSWRAEHLPVAGQQPVGGGDDPTRGRGRDGTRAARATGLAIARRGSRAPCGPHASPGRTWRSAQRTCRQLVADARDDLLRQTSGGAAGRTTGRTTHGATGPPRARLSPTAIVARVVATSESRPIGIAAPAGPPRRTRRARIAGPCPGRRATAWCRGRRGSTPWPARSCPAARSGRRPRRRASPWGRGGHRRWT